MVTRVLKASAKEFKAMSSADLLESIRKSEGRTIVTEIIAPLQPVLNKVTNAELAAAMGSDIMLLNMFDVQNPFIYGLPECEPDDTIRVLKELIGRPIAINLEPAVNPNEENPDSAPLGRRQSGNCRECKKSSEHGCGFDTGYR